MSSWIDRIAERRMLLARAEGKLQGLPGEGKPLPERPESSLVDPGEAIGFRIMAEAGVLPEEIALKKQIAQAKALYAEAGTDEERKAVMADIARLELRRDIAAEARRKFLKT